MKKILIAAAIVCAAAMSHAAALQWGMTGISQTKDSSLVNGAVGYFMLASTYEGFAAATDKAAYCAANYTYTANAVVGRTTGLAGTSGSYGEGVSISGYVVLFDTTDASKAGYYCNTGVITTEAPGTGNAKIQPTYTEGTGMTGGNAWTAIPEPTSGLLLLLGMAGLALRRKQK